jgi:hypothetical protein
VLQRWSPHFSRIPPFGQAYSTFKGYLLDRLNDISVQGTLQLMVEPIAHSPHLLHQGQEMDMTSPSIIQLVRFYSDLDGGLVKQVNDPL